MPPRQAAKRAQPKRAREGSIGRDRGRGIWGGGERAQVVGDPARLAGGGEDRLGIGVQQLEPAADVLGMPQPALDAELGAQERRGQLGDELLGGISPAAETPREVAGKPARMPRPVGVLVQASGVVVLRPFERAIHRQHDAVERGHVAGAITAMADVGAECIEKAFRPAMALALGLRRRHRVEVWRQALDLGDVEYPEVAQERHLPGAVLAGLCCPVVTLAGDGHLLHQDDRRPLLALADMAAQLVCLTEGEPTRQRIAAAERGRPQGQHVHPSIRSIGGGVARHALAAGAALPGLHPGGNALLELGHDRGRDLGVDLRTHGTLPAHGRRRPMRRRPMPGSPSLPY